MKRKIYAFILVLSAMGILFGGCADENAQEDKTEITSETVDETVGSIDSESDDETVDEDDSMVTADTMQEKPSEEVTETDTEVQQSEDFTEETSDEEKSEDVVEEISEEVEEKPEYSVSDMDKVMYAQRSVNVRTGPSTDYEKLGALNTNQAVTVTGQADTGWYRIDYDGKEGFVSDRYLGDGEVVVTQNSVPNEGNTQGSTAPAIDTTGLPSKVLCGEIYYVLRTTPNGTPIYETLYAQWPQYIVDIINECCTPEMSDLQKAQAIHDWMATNISYNLESYNHTTYSTLMYREAVCTGYAFAYQSLCYCVGIEASVVNGSCFNSKDEFIGLHAWNFIYIDGVKYHVDATWHMGPSTAFSLSPTEDGRTRIDYYDSNGVSTGHYRTMTEEDFYGHFDNLYSEKGVVYF